VNKKNDFAQSKNLAINLKIILFGLSKIIM